MERYVITGGPCTGKTTTIDELAKRGYAVVPESARQIIQEEQEKKHGILPWVDARSLYIFQLLVVHRQLALEKERTERIHFLDRGIGEGRVYCHLGGISPPDELLLQSKTNHYTGVFLLDQLQYIQDAQRKEDPILAKKIHEEIGKLYGELGYDLIRVPVLLKEERAQYIIERLKQ